MRLTRRVIWLTAAEIVRMQRGKTSVDVHESVHRDTTMKINKKVHYMD